MGESDSEEDSDENIARVPQRAKIIIVMSGVIMFVGFACFWVLMTLFTGSSINPSFG
jgi:hypothetical protein